MLIHGKLHNVSRITDTTVEPIRAPCLRGQIYGDTKGRFRDGEWVTTSRLDKEFPDNVFKTRFSVYQVVNWADAPVAANDNALSVDAYLLTSLGEECNEVGQRISKALRFSLAEVQPGQPLNNAERIAGECTDLLALIRMCERRGLFSVDRSEVALDAKEAKVVRYMKLAREHGALKGEWAA